MIDLERIRDYCLSKKGTTEDFPFDETTLVFRIAGKIYAFVNTHSIPFKISLKSDPEKAIRLREEYAFITPGYHLNKKYWNTVEISMEQDATFYFTLIDESYNIIFSGLTAKQKTLLGDSNS
jgi:predicted DNA-binding protein (MmcQ/YjbR family)